MTSAPIIGTGNCGEGPMERVLPESGLRQWVLTFLFPWLPLS